MSASNSRGLVLWIEINISRFPTNDSNVLLSLTIESSISTFRLISSKALAFFNVCHEGLEEYFRQSFTGSPD